MTLQAALARSSFAPALAASFFAVSPAASAVCPRQ